MRSEVGWWLGWCGAGWRACAAVAALALAVRLAYAFGWEGGALARQTPESDAAQYVEIAQSLADGTGFRMANGFRSYRPPLYPLVLAPFYRLAEHPIPAVLVVQAMLGAATCVLAMQLASALAGAGAGLAAGLISALSFELLSGNGRLLSETLFTCLFVAAILALVRWRARPSAGLALLAGVLLGLAVLSRSAVVLLPPALAAWMILALRRGEPLPRRRAWRHAGILLAAVGVLLAPWLARNQRLHGVVVLTTDMGKILYGSLSESATGGRGGYYVRGRDFVIPEALDAGSEAERSRRLARAALVAAARDPLRVVAQIPRKLANMWRPWPAGADPRATAAVALFLVPTLALILLRAGVLLRDWRRTGPALLACAYVTGLHAILMSEPRYRYPIMPLLFALAAVAGTRRCSVPGQRA